MLRLAAEKSRDFGGVAEVRKPIAQRKLIGKHGEQLREFIRQTWPPCADAEWLCRRMNALGDGGVLCLRVPYAGQVWSCQASFADDYPWKCFNSEVAFSHWGLYLV
ncbi:unnamed protein product, partial [Effrenium voratum]